MENYYQNKPFGQAESPIFSGIAFWYFWLAIQNTTNRHVSNAFDLQAVFISLPEVEEASFLRSSSADLLRAFFPLLGCCCCTKK